MRLVVDTNQASLLPPLEKGGLKITLSPYVLAEVLLCRKPEPTLQLLHSFDIRLGLETLDVLIELAKLTPQEIVAFEPFYVPGRKYRQNYAGILQALSGPREEHLELARYIKSRHREYCGSLVATSKDLRKRLRDLGIADQKFSAFEDAWSGMSSSPDSFMGSVIVGTITDDDQRPTQASPAELLEAVLANQYLRRFFRIRLAYHVSITRLWADQDLNFDPSPSRDDMTDVMLPLYAANGDIIVTADTTLSKLITHSEPEGRIKVCRAGEIP